MIGTRISVVRLLFPRSFPIIQQCGEFTSIRRYVKSTSKILFSKCHYSSSTNENTELEKFADEFEINESSNLFGNLDIKAITDYDPQKLEILKLLLIRLDMQHKKGAELPKKISVDRWREMLALPSQTQRMKFIKFLRKVERLKEENKLAKLEKYELFQKYKAKRDLKPKEVQTTSSPPCYGLKRTTIFMRFRETLVNKFYNYKLLDPLMYGPDIVFDFEYDTFMTRKEIGSAVNQIMHAWHSNRENIKPFNMMLCNLSKENKMYDKLKQLLPPMDVDPGYPMNITSKSYLDLYPRDKLIYLSPHAVDTMEYYDPDKIYIIGVMVDLVVPEPFSLAKAKKHGIKTMKFPLNKYINWRSGGKALNMDHCLRIMLSIKNGYDWKTTLLKHVPGRKLAEEHPEEPKQENLKLSARMIRRMYLKNKVHELIVDERRKIK